MKKLLSLIASVAMLASMFTTAYAADLANNKPVVDSVITELSAEEYEQDWIGEALGADEKAYLVEVNVSGLDLSNAASGTTNLLKKKRTGVLLMLASYELKFDSLDNVVAVYSTDGKATASTADKTALAILQYNNAPSAYPTTTDGNTTAVTATELPFLYQFIVVVNGEVEATPYSELKVSSFEKDSQTGTVNFGATEAQQASYTINGDEATSVTLGKEDDEMKITIGEAMAITAGDVNGIAWDVKVVNYDSARECRAFFSSNGVERNPAGQRIEFDIETEGDFDFAAILEKVKLGAEDTVDFQIKY